MRRALPRFRAWWRLARNRFAERRGWLISDEGIPFIDHGWLGEGGTAAVTLTRMWRSADQFVRKEFRYRAPRIETPEQSVARFVREVRIVSQLKHRNIVPIVAANTRSPRPWYVMPRLPTSLTDALETIHEDSRRATIVVQIMDGLHYAHLTGILHRDLKTDNVYLASDGSACIADFGLGRDTADRRSQTIEMGQGSEGFVAPEQREDLRKADARSDIYSFGKVIYCIYTASADAGEVNLSKLPTDVGRIVARCIDPDADKRFQSMDELKKAWRERLIPEERQMTASEFSVLVVDDEAQDREDVTQSLAPAGYQVTVAAAAPEAVAVLGKARVDLILIDMQMSGMSGTYSETAGMELFSFVKRNYPGTRVIMLTGVNSVRRSDQVKSMGAFAYLAKDETPPQRLREQVASCFAEYEQAQMRIRDMRYPPSAPWDN